MSMHQPGHDWTKPPCAAEGYDLNLPDDSPWYCTLPEGHHGDHEAWGLAKLYYRWPQEDLSVLITEIEAWLREQYPR